MLAELRPELASLRPGARWVDDDQETTPLPPGEWWVVDAVEGAVNYVHGLPEWAVTVTLLRDGQPVLTVVRQPAGDLTYTASPGRRRAPERTSAADVGQDAPGRGDRRHRPGGGGPAGHVPPNRGIGRGHARPGTRSPGVGAVHLPDAAGRGRPRRPVLAVPAGAAGGVTAGALLITEAGGTVSRIDGSAWGPGSPDILAAAPGLRQAAAEALTAIAPTDRNVTMQLTILAASGGTGRELTRQALERGHTVTAIARTPGRIDVPESGRLTRVAADVRDPDLDEGGPPRQRDRALRARCRGR